MKEYFCAIDNEPCGGQIPHNKKVKDCSGDPTTCFYERERYSNNAHRINKDDYIFKKVKCKYCNKDITICIPKEELREQLRSE